MLKLNGLISIALLVLVSFQGAKLAHSLIDPPPLPVQAGLLLSERQPPSPIKAPELAPLQAQLLFGDARGPGSAVQQPEVIQERPRLAVRLVGLLRSSRLEQSVAVLEHNGRQAPYRIGESLETDSSVELVEVSAQGVVLTVAGVPLSVALERSRYEAAYRGELIPLVDQGG